MKKYFISFGKSLLESNGRGNQAPRYIFQDNEIVSTPYPRKVWSMWEATYLNLHPTHYAVGIAPDGRILNLKGGYIRLSPGNYTIHYVDKQNRVMNIPRTGETTYDGAQVALEVVITYRVIDPIKALEVQQAVDTLQRFIQSDLKEFIRSHKYDDIMGDLEGRKLDDDQVAKYIKDQHARRHQMSKLFFIADVVIKEKLGDPKVTEIREKYQIYQRQYTTDTELQRQKQELEKKVASQEAAINQMRAEADASRQEIIQGMEMQRIELEKARAELQFRQEKWSRAMDAIAQAFSAQPYPRDPREMEIIRELLTAMSGSAVQVQESVSGAQAIPPDGTADTQETEKIDDLTNTLLNLLGRNSS